MDIINKVETQVKEAIEKYRLLKKSDKVVVALSGGKDSTSIIYILKKLGYDVHGLMIDLYLGSWSDAHKDNMKKFCGEHEIPLMFIDMKKELGQGICFIKAVLKEQKNLTGCTVCGIIKRWLLNRWAKKLKADKLVTGHNLDDEAQNVLMNFLKGNVLLGIRSSPATGWQVTGDGWQGDGSLAFEAKSSGFVQRVKPFFYVAENDIREYAKKIGFDILYDKCPCSFETYRSETRDWLDKISDDEKLKIVVGFQKKIPGLRKGDMKELKVCKSCGEPASSELCNACKIFESLDFKPGKSDEGCDVSCSV
ncbi:TIGR00269 family protein [Candidatus Pacearchaeota archaeon]|nr:TIGR00269 family protein [Candidatus Pacearchaeota archaeon]